jgi:putative transcriptional regulator
MPDSDVPRRDWSGRLLVATPALIDPNFARVVILLLQHSPDDGALGVVLNRPSGTDVAEVLPAWRVLTPEPARIFAGGPVQPQAAICLGRGRVGAPPSSSYAALPGGAAVLGTVDLDATPDDVAPAVEQVRIFAGYAGWSPGQLEDEVEEGSWWVLDALPGDPFSPRPEALWPQVLRRQGAPLAFAAIYPADPTLN